MTPRHRSRGFTLMESIIVMVVLGIAAVGIMAMQERLFANVSTVDGMQVSARLMHECAEQVLAQRRHTEDGYANVVTTNGYGGNQCSGLSALPGYTIPTVTITEPFSDGSVCPSNFSCKTVVITQGGLAPVTLMLVDY